MTHKLNPNHQYVMVTENGFELYDVTPDIRGFLLTNAQVCVTKYEWHEKARLLRDFFDNQELERTPERFHAAYEQLLVLHHQQYAGANYNAEVVPAPERIVRHSYLDQQEVLLSLSDVMVTRGPGSGSTQLTSVWALAGGTTWAEMALSTDPLSIIWHVFKHQGDPFLSRDQITILIDAIRSSW